MFHLDDSVPPLLSSTHHLVILERVIRGIIQRIVRIECKYPLAHSLTLFVDELTLHLPLLVRLIAFTVLWADTQESDKFYKEDHDMRKLRMDHFCSTESPHHVYFVRFLINL
jgi:hypothetical protein